jgi:RNase P/RNase MRP subunit POP5
MKNKLRSSSRVNKRYILIQGSKEETERIILEYIGILGWAKAAPQFVESKDKGKTILAVERKELNDVLAAFELSKKVKIIKISGTLKGLEK